MQSDIKLLLTPGFTESETRVEATGKQILPFTSKVAGAWGLGFSFMQGAFNSWGRNIAGNNLIPVHINYGDDIQPGPLLSTGNVIAAAKPSAYATIYGEPVNARIVSLDSQPAIINRVIWDNSKGTTPLACETEISLEVSRSISTSWTHEQSIGVSFTVGLEVGSEAAGTKSKFEETTSYSDTFGTSKEQSTTVNAGASSRVSKDVPAGQIMVAALVANRGILTAEVDIDFSLRGAIGAGYWRKGHHHEFGTSEPDGTKRNTPNIYLNIEDLLGYLKQAGKLHSTSTMTVTYDFFADGKVGVYTVPSVRPRDIEEAILG